MEKQTVSQLQLEHTSSTYDELSVAPKLARNDGRFEMDLTESQTLQSKGKFTIAWLGMASMEDILQVFTMRHQSNMRS